MKWLTAAIIALIASSSGLADPLAAPSLLTAAALSPTQVRVGWTDTNEVENAYIVEMATTTTVVGQVGGTPANGTSLTMSGLSPATIYRFRVRARAVNGNQTVYSPYSAIVSATTPTTAAPKAFPTAEGFGADAIGGRRGAVYIVSNLANSGAGSLRACAEASGPRTCVFHISGTIPLVTPIVVRQPFLTIAGQTSPHGVALKVATGNVKGTFEIWAHDVIVRHVRFRPGPSSMTTDNNDALVVQPGVYNVIVDHCSFSWSTDEIVNTLGTSEDKPGSERITFQWSMFYEGLSHSTHVSGEHSKGPFFFGRKITFHHNLIASNTMRNPNLTIEGRFDYLNNVVYNAVEMFGEVYDRQGVAQVNAVGNWTIMGPSSKKWKSIYGLNSFDDGPYSGDFGVHLHLQGNVGPRIDGSGFLDPNDTDLLVPQPIGGSLTARVTNALQAARDVLMFAGAFPRDASDQRVIANVRTCKGAVIDSPSQVGGWPVFQIVAVPTDIDRDGMADVWEVAHGISSGTADADGDGYTNLEEYLNELAGDNINRLGSGTGILPRLNCGYLVK